MPKINTPHKKSALNKRALSLYLVKIFKIEKALASDIIEFFFEEIARCIKKYQRLTLTGWGTFSTYLKKERLGRDIKTGKTVPIAPRNTVKFEASKRLRKKLHTLS